MNLLQDQAYSTTITKEINNKTSTAGGILLTLQNIQDFPMLQPIVSRIFFFV